MADDDILRDYIGWLRKVAGNLVGFDSPVLDDLVQEGYIAMWKALRDYNSSRGALPSWLTTKALWRMKDVLRRGHDLPLTSDGEVPDLASPDLLDSMQIAYHHGEIGDAISRLTPAQRKYVVARFWFGLSGQEMQRLGIFGYDPSALWNSRRNGARQKLRAELRHMEVEYR